MRTRGWTILGVAVSAIVVGATAFVVHEKNVEQPTYAVETRDGPFEVRRYPELLVAETDTSGTRDVALNAGFSRLAAYIFAEDRGGPAVAMTAPVLIDQAKPIAMTAPVISERLGTEWRTRFVMPAAFTRATLPPPGPGVRITTLPARRVAAYRFSGYATDAALADAEAKLRAWLARRGLGSGPVSYAYYNSPFMPGPLRRNEVIITIGA